MWAVADFNLEPPSRLAQYLLLEKVIAGSYALPLGAALLRWCWACLTRPARVSRKQGAKRAVWIRSHSACSWNPNSVNALRVLNLVKRPPLSQNGIACGYGVELRHLRYFVAVTEELSFTKAAQKLRLAQPLLPRQVRNLGEEIGVRLLDRSNNRVTVTGQGR